MIDPNVYGEGRKFWIGEVNKSYWEKNLICLRNKMQIWEPSLESLSS